MTDAHNAFAELGLQMPDNIQIGRFTRFPGVGKSSNNKAGYATLLPDGESIAFGDFASGASGVWFTDKARPRTRQESQDATKLLKEIQRQANRAKQAEYRAAARKAQHLFFVADAFGVSDHKYIIRKQIQPFCARLSRGSLILPIQSINKIITSLQFIYPNGDKRFLPGGKLKGCFIHVSGSLDKPDTIIICEGFSTGATIAEMKPNATVISALNAGNLKPVALALRGRYPTIPMTVAADDDRLNTVNTGLVKARQAAIAVGATLAVPQWPAGCPDSLSDFNDLAKWVNSHG